MANILPPADDYGALTPRPGSPVHRYFSDLRMAPMAGYAVLLQVAHPTVGHGVHQYSSFTRDPWGRLLRTLDYVNGTIYGGPRIAGETGARVRAMHRTIKGELPGGERYSAMDPAAFAWVHATLALAILEGRRRFIKPLDAAETQAFWTQWRDVGRLVGVRYRDLPETVTDLEAYAQDMFAHTLTWTPAVPEVMGTPDVAGSPHPLLPAAVWRVLARGLGHQFRVLTTGLLPPELRARLRLAYSGRDAAYFRAIQTAARASGPLIRGPLKEFGPYYVRLRRTAIERGDVASVHHPPRPRAAA